MQAAVTDRSSSIKVGEAVACMLPLLVLALRSGMLCNCSCNITAMADWMGILAGLPGLEDAQKRAAEVLILSKPAEDRQLYVQGTPSEAAGRVLALLAHAAGVISQLTLDAAQLLPSRPLITMQHPSHCPTLCPCSCTRWRPRW
jgi:hypothetical protein